MSAGTESPPLEATGEHIPIGASSTSDPSGGSKPAKDADQRAGYFPGQTSTNDEPAAAGGDIASAAAQAADSANSVQDKNRAQRED